MISYRNKSHRTWYMPSNYVPLAYSLRKADDLNVQIWPAINNHKKLSVWKNGAWCCDIGAKNHLDFPTMLEMEREGIFEKGYAYDKQRDYKRRHRYDKGDIQFYTNRILW